MPENQARQVPFPKRETGVLQKAFELSVLTECETAVVIFSNDNQKLYEELMSTTEERTLNGYEEHTGASERRLCLTVFDERVTGVRRSRA